VASVTHASVSCLFILIAGAPHLPQVGQPEVEKWLVLALGCYGISEELAVH